MKGLEKEKDKEKEKEKDKEKEKNKEDDATGTMFLYTDVTGCKWLVNELRIDPPNKLRVHMKRIDGNGRKGEKNFCRTSQ